MIIENFERTTWCEKSSSIETLLKHWNQISYQVAKNKAEVRISIVLQKLYYISEIYSSFKTFVNISSLSSYNFDWLNPAIFVFNAIFLSLQVFLSYRGDDQRGQLQVRKASIVTWSKSFTINYPASTQNRNTTKSSPELVNNLHLHSIKTQKKGDASIATVWKNPKFTLT